MDGLSLEDAHLLATLSDPTVGTSDDAIPPNLGKKVCLCHVTTVIHFYLVHPSRRVHVMFDRVMRWLPQDLLPCGVALEIVLGTGFRVLWSHAKTKYARLILTRRKVVHRFKVPHKGYHRSLVTTS